jgi:hypothetical protein
MTDFASVFVRKIKHKMERSREVLPADADLRGHRDGKARVYIQR